MSKGNRKRRQALELFADRVPDPDRKCHAHSARTGEPCKRPPMKGQAVCRAHGGAAPQAIRKAKERIALASGDAVSVLVQIMTDPGVSASDRRQAATALLDRAGITTKAELEVTVAPWISLLEGAVEDVPESADLSRRHKYPTLPGSDARVVVGEVLDDA